LTGFSFPTLKESDAMFLSEKAPDWHDGEFCHRCRVQFGLVQRKVDTACTSIIIFYFIRLKISALIQWTFIFLVLLYSLGLKNFHYHVISFLVKMLHLLNL